MPAKAKTLSNKTLDGDQYAPIRNVANKIIEILGVLRALEPAVKAAKGTLTDQCREIFFTDLDAGEVNGNHVFKSTKGELTVNFKLASGADITQYQKTLLTYLGEHYEELFEEREEIAVTGSQRAMQEQFKDYPGAFRLELKHTVKDDDMKRLYKRCPEMFNLIPWDTERYANLFPKCVERDTKVYPKGGFIEKLGRVEGDLRKRVLKALQSFFEKNLEMAVKGG